MTKQKSEAPVHTISQAGWEKQAAEFQRKQVEEAQANEHKLIEGLKGFCRMAETIQLTNNHRIDACMKLEYDQGTRDKCTIHLPWQLLDKLLRVYESSGKA